MRPQRQPPPCSLRSAHGPCADSPGAGLCASPGRGSRRCRRAGTGLCDQRAARCELLLQRPFALWLLGLPGRLRLVLATARRCGFSRLAALLRWRLLGLQRCRLVLAVHLFLGLGAVPLWAVVCAPALRLGLDAGSRLGASLGDLADGRRLLRLGALAAACRIRCGLGWRFNGVSVGANFGFGLGVNAFAFVSFGNFCSHDIGHHCLPPAQVTTVYHQTTIINNYTVVNNTIVHRGIPIERVSAASRAPVPRATVHDLPAGGGQVAEPDGVGSLSASAPGAGTTGEHGCPEGGCAASSHSARPDHARQNGPSVRLQQRRPGSGHHPAPAGNASAQNLALVERREARFVSAVTRRPEDLSARVHSALPPQRPGRLQTGPAARNPRPRRNTSQPPGHPSRRPQRSPRRQRRGHPRIGSKGAGWRPATGPTRACRLIPPLARLFKPGPRQGRHLLQKGYYPKGYHQAAEMHPPSPIRSGPI